MQSSSKDTETRAGGSEAAVKNTDLKRALLALLKFYKIPVSEGTFRVKRSRKFYVVHQFFSTLPRLEMEQLLLDLKFDPNGSISQTKFSQTDREILRRDLHRLLDSTTASSASDYQQSQFLTWARTSKGPVNAVTSRIGGVDQYSQFISKLLVSLLMLVEELTAVRYQRLFRLDPQLLRITIEDVGRCITRWIVRAAKPDIAHETHIRRPLFFKHTEHTVDRLPSLMQPAAHELNGLSGDCYDGQTPSQGGFRLCRKQQNKANLYEQIFHPLLLPSYTIPALRSKNIACSSQQKIKSGLQRLLDVGDQQWSEQVLLVPQKAGFGHQVLNLIVPEAHG
ncbi:hypothetical protein MIR68_005447 [Amoeboaphelidium protococcarum]|nr:hypothetical protein MIR68_005447 [Amoeboaphelidium protococcarum]